MSCCVCKCNLFHIFHRTKCVRVLCLSLLCVTSGEWPSSPSHVVEPLGLAAHPNNHSTFPVGGNERYSQSITAVAIIRARALRNSEWGVTNTRLWLCVYFWAMWTLFGPVEDDFMTRMKRRMSSTTIFMLRGRRISVCQCQRDVVRCTSAVWPVVTAQSLPICDYA